MDNDDTQASITAHRQRQWERSKAAWQWLQAHMAEDCDKALAKFVEINPQLKGIEWWDALDMLDDSDSHLEIIEPMVDLMPDWDKTRDYITLTLLYADREFATAASAWERTQMVNHLIKEAK